VFALETHGRKLQELTSIVQRPHQGALQADADGAAWLD